MRVPAKKGPEKRRQSVSQSVSQSAVRDREDTRRAKADGKRGKESNQGKGSGVAQQDRVTGRGGDEQKGASNLLQGPPGRFYNAPVEERCLRHRKPKQTDQRFSPTKVYPPCLFSGWHVLALAGTADRPLFVRRPVGPGKPFPTAPFSGRHRGRAWLLHLVPGAPAEARAEHG
jgi:hypothetical protein